MVQKCVTIPPREKIFNPSDTSLMPRMSPQGHKYRLTPEKPYCPKGGDVASQKPGAGVPLLYFIPTVKFFQSFLTTNSSYYVTIRPMR